MKIVVATPMYPPEIAEPAPYVKETSRRLSVDHEVTIVAYASTSEKTPGANLITVDKRNPLPIRLLKYTYTLFCASRDAEIIYVQGGTAAGLPAVIVGRLRNIPVVLRFNEDEAWERATQQGLTTKSLEDFLKKPEANFHIRIIMLLQKLALRMATIIVTTSHHQKDTLVRKYGIQNTEIETVYNPAPKPEIIPFPEEKISHQIAVAAKLTSWSGIDTTIRAILILLKKFPDVRLIIAGEGEEKETLKKLTDELSLGKHVDFLGHVSRAENWHIRKVSHVYIESTLKAGSLDKISWSFLAGVPVIASKVPVLNEGVLDGTSGILVEPGDEVALAEAVQKIFTNNDFTNALAQGRIKMLHEKFSWEAHLAGLNKIFSTLQTNEKK